MSGETVFDITSVWSSFGHVFMGDGEYDTADDGTVLGSYESCLTCGAHYVLRLTPDGFSDGGYFTNGGDEPAECTRDTAMVHGYSGERVHWIGERGSELCEGCPSCEHDCRCVFCDS